MQQALYRYADVQKATRSLNAWRCVMKFLKLINRLVDDEDGAALIEYTVLLGILLIAVIATIGLVGTWISGQWTALNASLPAK
jgi:pilus assembly protein Flp/PilA